MAAATVPTVVPTKLPPATAWKTEGFDAHQFYIPHVAAVTKAKRDADGNETSQSGLSFDDFRSCHVEARHNIGRRRRLDCPFWAMNDVALRKLLTFHYQLRCGIKKPVITDDPNEQKRLLNKCQVFEELELIPRLTVSLDCLCRAYVDSQDPKEKSRLAMQIASVDSRIRIIRHGPGLVVRLVFDYYRRGLNSVQTAVEATISPVCARQLLHRLGQNWCRMTGEQFIPHHWHRSESERPKLEPRAARQQNIRRAIVAHKLCAAQKRLAAAQVELAELLASREHFISERVERARQTYERRQARANAEVAAVRERVLSLAVGVL